VVLAGPDPRELVDPITPDELRTDVRWALGLWQAWFRSQDSISRRALAVAVLSHARILHTLALGEVSSKRVAGEWALQTLDAEWAPLIRWALDDRPDPWMKVHEPADPALLCRTRQFTDYVKSLAPEGVTAEVTLLHDGPPVVVEVQGPIVDAALAGRRRIEQSRRHTRGERHERRPQLVLVRGTDDLLEDRALESCPKRGDATAQLGRQHLLQLDQRVQGALRHPGDAPAGRGTQADCHRHRLVIVQEERRQGAARAQPVPAGQPRCGLDRVAEGTDPSHVVAHRAGAHLEPFGQLGPRPLAPRLEQGQQPQQASSDRLPPSGETWLQAQRRLPA